MWLLVQIYNISSNMLRCDMAITKMLIFFPGAAHSHPASPPQVKGDMLKCCTVFSQQKRVTLKMQRTLWKVFSPKFCNRVLLRVLRIYKNARILIDSGVFHWWSLGDSNPWLPHCQCGTLASWAKAPVHKLAVRFGIPSESPTHSRRSYYTVSPAICKAFFMNLTLKAHFISGCFQCPLVEPTIQTSFRIGVNVVFPQRI